MKDYIVENCINTLYDKGIRFISGKWFNINTKEEIKDFNKYAAKSLHIIKQNDLDEILDSFKLWYNDSEHSWLELPLVSLARNLGPLDSTSGLPIDLDDKQYIIINRLLYHPEDEIMFITTGCGGSGKSTFLNLIKQLFDNDVSATTLDQLSNDFLLTEAVKHRLIASDELAKGELSMSKLKTLISKQRITCNPKHQASYDVKTQSVLFYCCNKAPKIDITDTGILRRIVYYFRNTKIANPDKSKNKTIYTQDELLAVARRALYYEYLNENDKWLDLFIEETHKILLESNSVYLYFKENNEPFSDNELKYEDYTSFCIKKRLKPYSEPNYDDILSLIKEWNVNV